MYATCSAVLSEGGSESSEAYHFSVSNNADISATTTRTPILAIRPSALYNGQVNRIEIIIDEYGGLAGANSVLFELVYAPTSLTVTGGWTAVDAESSIEFHRVITAMSGGIVAENAFIGSSSANKGSTGSSSMGRMPLTLDSTGANPIAMVLCATSTTATSNVRGKIDWHESR